MSTNDTNRATTSTTPELVARFAAMLNHPSTRLDDGQADRLSALIMSPKGDDVSLGPNDVRRRHRKCRDKYACTGPGCRYTKP